jgi:hypothetical protein
MQRQGVPKHRVTERKVAREDTKEGVHKRSRKLQERHRGGAHGKRATERVQMLGRTGAPRTAAGRDVVGSRVGCEALPGDRRLRAHMTAEATIQRCSGRERRWQKQRGAADSLGPRMSWRQRSMSSGTKMQAVMGVRTLRCGLQTCSIADERSRTHSCWEALDKRPEGLRGIRTRAESIQPLHEIPGPRRPDESQTEEGCQRSGVGDHAESHHACASDVRTPRAGPTPPCHARALGG